MVKKYKIILASSALLFIPVIAAQAQTTFAPDRPGLGDGSYVLHPQVLYLELGIEYDHASVIDQFNFGQIMLRYGLVQNVELRVSLNSYVVEDGPVSNESGFTDPGLGLKFNLFNDPESPLVLSGLVSVSIPAGYSPFTDDNWVPSAALLADYQISNYWSINSNLGYSLNPGVFMFTLTPGFAIGESNYAGYFGYAAFLSSVDDQQFIEGGITRLVGEYIQLDINGGVDVPSGDFFVGAGFAHQF